ncbi:plasmolipin isoform X1 [Herpailurus yagouaroundi]|uniref:plasmolipin isoform X1 n=1 Tax=Herpailurus yagouaroundi TaxID=1608482 RepID=UPI001AD68B10|nr:plasmolipin isoform X1 [Puma yagouaroundi]
MDGFLVPPNRHRHLLGSHESSHQSGASHAPGSLARAFCPLILPILQVLGLLVWALIADTPYHLYPAYGWVMFVAVFLWLVTIVFFILYLFQLHMKLYMVPWPLVLMIFNVGATVLYITAFITCSAAVELTSLKGTRPYNQRAAASFFACLVMIAYGVSAFFSFQAWRGVGSNAATSQMAGGYA